jgi:stage V sporulation protein AD
MTKRTGKQTIQFSAPPSILSYSSVVGKKEGEGPIAKDFDYINNDTTFGEASWEKSESRMQMESLTRTLNKAGISPGQVDYIYAGDLMNQCIATSFGLRSFEIPLFGLYGACSTMAEGIGLASMAIDGGYASNSAVITSSHYCSAERQYRTPLEYGSQRTPLAQWTVTGSGSLLLGESGQGPYITHFTTGIIVDLGIKDAANMGAAMAPAAHSTITALFEDTNTTPSCYDLIITGDLGYFGNEILLDLFKRSNVTFNNNLGDCGIMIFDKDTQDVHSGGSGCGCSAVTLCGKLLNDMKAGKLNKLVFAGTGALLSPTSTLQGETIPGICHAVVISNTIS